MAKEQKVKAPEPRDVLRAELAQLLMEHEDLPRIERTKEGLVISRGEVDLVVRVIQKKERVEANAIVETIERETWEVPLNPELAEPVEVEEQEEAV